MSARYAMIPAFALSDSRLSPRDITVICALGVYADKRGLCHPSQVTLGEQLGVSRQAIQKSIKHLLQCGYLTKKTRQRANGAQSSNEYHVNMDYCPENSHLRDKDPCNRELPPPQPQVAPPATPEVAPPATPEVAPPATPEVAPPATPEVAGITLNVPLEHPILTKKNIQKTKPQKPTTMPDNFSPNAANQAYAAKHNIDLDEVLETFCNNTSANGKMYVNWHAGLGTYLQNAKKWRVEKQEQQQVSVHGVNGAYQPAQEVGFA